MTRTMLTATLVPALLAIAGVAAAQEAPVPPAPPAPGEPAAAPEPPPAPPARKLGKPVKAPKPPKPPKVIVVPRPPDVDHDRIREDAERAREQAERAREQAERARERWEREAERWADNDHEPTVIAMGRDDDDKKTGPTSVKVKGPVRFAVEVVEADVEIVAAGSDTVSVTAKGCGPGDVELDQDGNDFEADFADGGTCQGPVQVRVPAGSSVEVSTVQGGIKLKGTYKNVEASAVTGAIDVENAENAEIEAVQGNVTIGQVTRADVESVSGNVSITTKIAAPRLDVELVNGSFTWRGACGAGCRMSVESFNGNVTLQPDKASSFEIRFSTQSGKLVDNLGLSGDSGKKNVKGYTPVRARYGKGEGSIRVETYNGDLTLKK